MRWIIGDIHGMLLPLRTLVGEISRRDEAAQLLFVGDYVNRGPDSRGVIDLLLTLNNARFIRGNHDDIFVEILTGKSYCHNISEGDRVLAFRWFLQHGLDATLISYGISPADLKRLSRRGSPRELDAAMACVPENHLRFLSGLPAVIEEPDFFVAHGKWPLNDSAENLDHRLTADARRREPMLWGRFELEELLRAKAWTRPGYFGHTSVENYPAFLPTGEMVPIAASKIILLDTAAALHSTGRLTAFCHETRTYLQADPAGKLVRP